jgi:hypothetical protein
LILIFDKKISDVNSLLRMLELSVQVSNLSARVLIVGTYELSSELL